MTEIEGMTALLQKHRNADWRKVAKIMSSLSVDDDHWAALNSTPPLTPSSREGARTLRRKSISPEVIAAPRSNGSSIKRGTPKPGWPAPLRTQAYYGLAGEILQAIEPHSEADPAGLLLQFLAAFGNCVGPNPHFKVESDRHPARLFVVLAGETSVSRKRTSWNRIRELLLAADPTWERERVLSGFSSGEGVIWSVRDPITKLVWDPMTGERVPVIADQGVRDKRALIIETEFASALQVLKRPGNTLAAVLRDAWDREMLQSPTKNPHAKATGAHVAIIGHIIPEELLRHLTSIEEANGFANRILWVAVRRSKYLPDGGNFRTSDYPTLITNIESAIRFAKEVHEVKRDEEASELWRAVYRALSDAPRGLLGAITARAPTQVLRLSLIYALLDKSPVIRGKHLRAALAVWRYCEASARYIFGENL